MADFDGEELRNEKEDLSRFLAKVDEIGEAWPSSRDGWSHPAPRDCRSTPLDSFQVT